VAHAQTPPAECGTCTKIHAVLLAHQRKALGQPLTGAAIAAAAGVSRQATLTHIAHMIECGWIAADRRTAIKQGTAAPLPARTGTPLQWATDAALSCRTCGRLLLVLATAAAPGEWFTRMSELEIASALGIGERAVRKHIAALTGRRAHATHPMEAAFLHGQRIPGTAGRGGLQWMFLDGKARPGALTDDYSREEFAEMRSVALDVLAQAPLITSGMNARERRSAAELLVCPRLHLGWPPAAILAAMTDPGDHEETVKGHAYGLIRWRLDERAPGAYVASAALTYDRTPVWHDCTDCRDPFHAPVDVVLCPKCYRRERAGISLDNELDADAREYQRIRGLITA
jgi:biotin operon repressor